MTAPMHSSRLAGGIPRPMIYVITCGMCGQTWQRITAREGQIINCIFCGSQGYLRLGVAPSDPGARRVEVWLHALGGSGA